MKRMKYIKGFINLPTTKLFHRCWVGDEVNTLVVGIHGFVEHSGRYLHVGNEFASNNYTFCMHDLRGHGRSVERKEDLGFINSFNDFIEDLNYYINHLKRELNPKNIVVFGHSMGGLIALYCTALRKVRIDAVITSGAATLLRTSTSQVILLKLMNLINPRARIKLPLNPQYLSHREDVVNAYVNDPLVIKNPTVRLVYELVRASKEFWRYVDRIETPILLLHGSEDKIVPPEASRKVFELVKCKIKNIKIYDGLYHEILNEVNWRVVLRDIIKWLSNVLK